MAFKDYMSAVYAAQRKPRQVGGTYSAAADFTKFSFDPLRTQESAYIASLAADDEAFRGTPPSPRVEVLREELHALPYPIALLTDCPTPAPNWVAYDTQTNKPVAYVSAKVPPPYLATVTVIFFQGHWGVQKISFDAARTCTG